MTELPINVQTLMQLLQLRGAEILRLTEDNAKLRAELETANANCDRMAALAIDNAKDTARLRAVLKEMVHQFERNGMTRWPIYHEARAALTAQPAAPGGDK